MPAIAERRPMDVNLIDLHVSGHHRSYLEMLASFWTKQVQEGTLRIFVTAGFLTAHSDFVPQSRRIEVITLDIDDIENLDMGFVGMVRLGRAHAKALKAVASGWDGPIVLMYFDHGQLAMATYRGEPRMVSGLYFRSPFHELGSRRMSRARAIRKNLVLRMSLRNRGVHRIFCLDSRDVGEVDRVAGRPVAVPLPDGVIVVPPSKTRLRQRSELGVEDRSHIFLLIGVIGRRKGLAELANAVDRMEKGFRDRMVLVVAGTRRPDEAPHVRLLLNEMREHIRVVDINQRIPEGDMAALFAASDTVLVAYTSLHTGSSGILIHAAASSTPVIGPSTGLMASHIVDHKLGQTIDPNSPKDFAVALQDAIQDPSIGFDQLKALRFAEANSDRRFSETVFSEIGCSIGRTRPAPGP